MDELNIGATVVTSLVSSGFTGGVVWGAMRAEVKALRRDVERLYAALLTGKREREEHHG